MMLSRRDSWRSIPLPRKTTPAVIFCEPGQASLSLLLFTQRWELLALQIVLRKDFKVASPLLETPKWWIVHGFNEDLNVAMRDASLEMLSLLTDHVGLSRKDAYSLMSVATDFAVTQVVDGRQGVHVRAPRSIFPAKGEPSGEA